MALNLKTSLHKYVFNNFLFCVGREQKDDSTYEKRLI